MITYQPSPKDPAASNQIDNFTADNKTPPNFQLCHDQTRENEPMPSRNTNHNYIAILAMITRGIRSPGCIAAVVQGRPMARCGEDRRPLLAWNVSPELVVRSAAVRRRLDLDTLSETPPPRRSSLHKWLQFQLHCLDVGKHRKPDQLPTPRQDDATSDHLQLDPDSLRNHTSSTQDPTPTSSSSQYGRTRTPNVDQTFAIFAYPFPQLVIASLLRPQPEGECGEVQLSLGDSQLAEAEGEEADLIVDFGLEFGSRRLSLDHG